MGSKSSWKLPAGHLHDHGQGQTHRDFVLGEIRQVGTDDLHLAVFHLFHALAGDQLDGLGLAAAASRDRYRPSRTRSPSKAGPKVTGMGILVTWTFRPRTSMAFWPMSVMGTLDDHVLVGADTGGQHLGDAGVGDGGEAPVDGARGVGVPLVGDVAQGIDEGEVGPCCRSGSFRSRPGLTPPKAMAARQAKPRAKTAPEMSGPKGTSRVGQPICTPASTSCSGTRCCRRVLAAHEDVEVLLLEFQGDLRGLPGPGAAPTMAANPGAVPSTNSTPLFRKMMSSAAPSQILALLLSMTSSPPT